MFWFRRHFHRPALLRHKTQNYSPVRRSQKVLPERIGDECSESRGTVKTNTREDNKFASRIDISIGQLRPTFKGNINASANVLMRPAIVSSGLIALLSVGCVKTTFTFHLHFGNQWPRIDLFDHYFSNQLSR